MENLDQLVLTKEKPYADLGDCWCIYLLRYAYRI